MPVYSYKATDFTGKVVQGTLEAVAEKEVVRHLQGMGYVPIRIQQAGKVIGAFDVDFSRYTSAVFSRISTKDVVIFTQDLSALLAAGLPVDRALTILIDVVEKEKFREVIRDILKTVQGGSYLSDALARYSKIFSSFYINMIKAGEAGGVLEAVLERLSVFLESSQELKEFTKSAMVYPLFLVFVGGISIIILLTFVIPKFSVIFADMGQSIPFTTRLLLDLSAGLRSYWWVILAVLGGGYFALRKYVHTAAGKLAMDTWTLKLPLIGDLVRKIEVARFARTLGTLMRSGVPILQALNLVKDIIGNLVIARSMTEVHDRVKEGERLSRPLLDTGTFPSLAIQMVTVGEETGRLDEMLLRVADNYEKIIKNLVKRFTSLLEPAMILAMGLVVGFIVISMLMAIFSMNEMPF